MNDLSLSLPAWGEIETICRQFEQAWRNGTPPSLESALQQATPSRRPPLLVELLLLEATYRQARGEVVAWEDFARRFASFRQAVWQARDRFLQLQQAAVWEPGSMVGAYRIERLIGCGAFAQVFAAWDTSLGRRVALKTPSPATLDRIPVEHFLREARLAAPITHPHIVGVYGASVAEDGQPYVVLQYIDGMTLRDTLQMGPLSLQRALEVMIPVTEAVAEAHRHGLVHRDLKPGNILLDRTGRPYVTDFGLAVDCHTRHLFKWDQAGTLEYMAPEQLMDAGVPVDHRADIWSLGIILYELVSGRRPFQGRDREELLQQIRQQRIEPLGGTGRQYRRLEQLVRRCLKVQPEERLASCQELLESMRPLLRGRRRSRRHWLVAAGTGAAALAAMGAGLAGWHPWSASPQTASLDLRVWDPVNPYRRAISIYQPGALPLRSGDRVRLVARVDVAAYLYLLWIDAAASLLPVYPWHGGDWRRRPARESKVQELSLPEEAGRAWEMEVPRAGLESILLLGAGRPVRHWDFLRRQIGSLLAPLPWRRTAPLRFSQGSMVVQPPSSPRYRGPRMTQSADTADPVLRLHAALASQLLPLFSLVEGVTFPVGDPRDGA